MSMTRQDSFNRIMREYGGQYGERVLSAYGTYELIQPWYKWLLEKYKARNTLPPAPKYTVTVNGSDNMYNELNEWVIAQLPKPERKYIEVRTTRFEPYIRQTVPVEHGDLQTFVNGHPVTVTRTESTPKNRPEDNVFGSPPIQGLQKLVFVAQSEAGRDAVLDFLQQTAQKQRERTIDPDDQRTYIMTPSKYAGEWNYRDTLPPRPITSVYLKGGQLERITADIQAFLDNEEHYKKLSQPWHRGYLFYGPPGTGKTSMARALSDHFQMPIHWLSLADIDKDADLVSLIANIESRSMLLLEDIDAFDTAKGRDDVKHASIAALLNALDGIWTPNGLVTVMTTNEPEKLDEALVRAGRIGLAEEFGYMDLDQVLAMAEYAGWMPEDPSYFVGKSPADFMEDASRALLGLESRVDAILSQVLGS